MKRPKIDFIDRMLLIEYENGTADFNGVSVRKRIKRLRFRRLLANRFNYKRKRAGEYGKRF